MSFPPPGFVDAEAQSQACFRALLAAHAAPGSLHAIGAGLEPPAPLHVATAAVLLTLLDADTPLWLAPVFDPGRAWLSFHARVPHAAEMAAARFVCTDILPDLSLLDAGSDEAPEDGATVIVQLAALGEGSALRLAGPGLAAPATLRAVGLPADFSALWAARRGLYPRGVDLILCAGNQLAALPRSIDVTAG